MALDRDLLFREILNKIGHDELERVKVLIGSRTLRDAIYLAVYASLGQARLVIPHYWAVYYHDGRAGFGPVSASKLVFFEDPLVNDPRLNGSYSRRAEDEERLTREQYEHGLMVNAERRAAGQPPYMFVVDAVGPSRPRPFFNQLANGAANRAGFTIGRIFDKHIQMLVDDDPDVKPERKTAEFEF